MPQRWAQQNVGEELRSCPKASGYGRTLSGRTQKLMLLLIVTKKGSIPTYHMNQRCLKGTLKPDLLQHVHSYYLCLNQVLSREQPFYCLGRARPTKNISIQKPAGLNLVYQSQTGWDHVASGFLMTALHSANQHALSLLPAPPSWP